MPSASKRTYITQAFDNRRTLAWDGSAGGEPGEGLQAVIFDSAYAKTYKKKGYDAGKLPHQVFIQITPGSSETWKEIGRR